MNMFELFKVINQVARDRQEVLDLWSRDLTQLPQEISILANLVELDLNFNLLTVLPSEIGQLTNLVKLDVGKNQLRALPPEIGQLSKLETLNLRINRLTALPPKIGQLSTLKTLNLSGNQLTVLPREIGQLSNLRILDLSSNQLRALPPEIGQLGNLRVLSLSNNQLKALPPEIGQLDSLTELHLASNQLTVLPPELGVLSELRELTVDNNPLTSPPSEVILQGTSAALAFLRNIWGSETNRYEAKLLFLGQGGVGKSSILRRLQERSFEVDLSTTYGVEVTRLEVLHPAQSDILLQLNCWDFAGQEIEHATHQFFMTSKSVYLLVWNARYGHVQARLNYWLEMIKSRAPEAPVLLVATHIDQRAPDINFPALQEMYPQLVGEYGVDNKSGRGIKELLRAIAVFAANLPLMGQVWPGTWQEVELDLKRLDEHHISYDHFVDICGRHGLTTNRDVEVLADTLHNLGIILHFDDDPALKNLVILKPNWITKAISLALTDEVTRDSFGRLKHEDLRRIWRAYASMLYPAFYSLMSKYDLCYKLENIEGQSLIPALLSFKPPRTEPIRTRLEMVFRLSSVPPGLMSRFIVRTHRFTQNIHWREGVMLAYDGQQARAELFENQREFRLTVGGSYPINFFAILTDTMNQILTDYPGLEVSRLIPCICQGVVAGGERCSHYYSYESLVKRIERGKTTIECDASYQEVNVNQLLFGIHVSAKPQVVEQVRQIQTIREEDRQLVLLGQRSIIQEYNRLESIDTRCPNSFLISQDKSGKPLLQLICQSSEGWHFASRSACYELPRPGEFAQATAPLIAESLPLLEYTIPLSGFDVNLRSTTAGVAERVDQSAIGLMRQIVSQVDTRRGRLEGLREALGQLYSFLTELDPDQIYGGLRMATTAAGYRVWLCPYHYSELQMPPLQMDTGFDFDVFLCHNSKEKADVRQVAAKLKEMGIKPWLDEEQILGGDKWQDTMARGLHESPVTVVFVGRHGWGDWQLEELQVALSQAAGQRKHRVIPVLLPPLVEPPGDFPAFLKTRHALRFPEEIDRLAESIRARPVLEGKDPSSES